MAYRCLNCQSLAAGIDEPHCKDNCKEFIPQKLVTIHLGYIEDGVRKLRCIGGPPSKKALVHSTSVPVAATCFACRTAYADSLEEKTELERNPDFVAPVEEDADEE